MSKVAGVTAKIIQDELDRCMPAANKAKLGKLLVDLINAANAVEAAHAAYSVAKAGLVIHGGGSTLAKAASPVAAVVNGVLVRHAPADLPAFAGNLATAKSAAWAFYLDGSSTLHIAAKTADSASHDAALAALPATPAGYALIGVVVIDNATGSNFVGGTTALDTGSLTVTYYDIVGPVVTAANVAAMTVGALDSR